jgi:hypothetical protein
VQRHTGEVDALEPGSAEVFADGLAHEPALTTIADNFGESRSAEIPARSLKLAS